MAPSIAEDWSRHASLTHDDVGEQGWFCFSMMRTVHSSLARYDDAMLPSWCFKEKLRLSASGAPDRFMQ
jgi:hypothetical protein